MMIDLNLTITITTLNMYGQTSQLNDMDCQKGEESKMQLNAANWKLTLNIKTQVGQENGDVDNVNMGQKNDYINIK